MRNTFSRFPSSTNRISQLENTLNFTSLECIKSGGMSPEDGYFHILLSYCFYTLQWNPKFSEWCGLFLNKHYKEDTIDCLFLWLYIIVITFIFFHNLTQWPSPNETSGVDFSEIVSTPGELQFATLTEGSFARGLLCRAMNELWSLTLGKRSHAPPSHSSSPS